MIRIQKCFPVTLQVDGESVKFKIRRLTQDEYTAFSMEFMRLGKLHEVEQLELRPHDEDERAMSERQLEAKHWHELAPEERVRREAQDKAEADRGNAFAAEVLTAYVTVEPDQIFDEETGLMVTSGADLVRAYGSRPDVLSDLVGEIFLQNRLSADDKKKLQLLRALRPGSTGPAMAPGAKPEPIAASAEPAISASPEAATVGLDESPSGVTAP
jgi:hypothetical protein